MRGAAVGLQWRIAPQRRGRQDKVVSPGDLTLEPEAGGGRQLQESKGHRTPRWASGPLGEGCASRDGGCWPDVAECGIHPNILRMKAARPQPHDEYAAVAGRAAEATL